MAELKAYEDTYRSILGNIVSQHLSKEEEELFEDTGDVQLRRIFETGNIPEGDAANKELRAIDAGATVVLLLGVLKVTFELLKSWIEYRKSVQPAPSPAVPANSPVEVYTQKLVAMGLEQAKAKAIITDFYTQIQQAILTHQE